MKPLKHQEKFVSNYDGKMLLAHEGGTGKTICGCLWLADPLRLNQKNLVVCPKRVVKKWEKALLDWGAKAIVMSKEEFKKKEQESPWPDKFENVVVDEIDEFASPLFLKGRSQLTESLYNLVKEHKPKVLGLSATPIRSSPHNLHTILTLCGTYIPWGKWRDYFYEFKKMPYLPRAVWLPRPDWRTRIKPILKKYADIVHLSDCVDELPAKIEEIVKVPKDTYVPTEWEGSAAFYEEYRHEQKNKAKIILEEAKDFQKVIIVAYFKEQIDELQKVLSKDRPTYAIHGGVPAKKQESIIEAANACDECFFIIQSSMGAGFDCNTFNCVMFASMGYSVRDYTQMTFRVRRIHDLRPVKFVYLHAGRCDKAIYKNIQEGKDFVPTFWNANQEENES